MTQSGNALARLLAAVVNSREQEGARVARLLHDEVGQILSAAGLHLDVLRMDIEDDTPEVARRISETQKLLEQAVDQVRALSYELNPEVVERAGLPAAMDQLVGRYRNRSQIKIRLLFDASFRLPGHVATAVYKIADRALDNAVRHSGCKRIELFVRPARQGVVLEVRDNGSGFDFEGVSEEPAGLGLLLMGCYAEQGGLQFEVQTGPGKGTIVKAWTTEPAPA